MRPLGTANATHADLFDDSCLNGWTMGNIAATPRAVASFFHLLHGGQLLSADSLAQMHNFSNMGWTEYAPRPPNPRLLE